MQAICPQCATPVTIEDARALEGPFGLKCPQCQAVVRFPGRAAAPAATAEGPTAEMDELFRTLVSMKASDLHMSVGSPPLVRHDGEIKPLPDRAVLTAADTERMLWPIAPERNREEFKRRHDTDFAYEIAGLARFRCNLFMDRKGMGGVFRVIPSKILTAEEMGLSREILQLCHLPKGLVLVTGPTGSGKSTTLCALIDYVNRHRTDHIITIEDPLEFVHENKKCLINQRQVGEHTDSFKDALRAALREDPDIVMVGEMRDLETVAIAIETAETGHLVFGTLHTSSAPSTVDRIIDQFPADRQGQIRVMLAESLKGVISQMLCKKIGGGRVPVLEVLIGIPAIANLIREAKIFQIPSSMQTGKKYGMCLMNDSFTDLVKQRVVAPQEAYAKAVDKAGLLAQFKKNGIDTSWAPAEFAPVVLPAASKAKVLRVRRDVPEPEALARAVEVLRAGDLLIYPTDTLYALGGLALEAGACRKVRAAKGRSDAKPLPTMAADLKQIGTLASSLPPEALRLAERFWPGPLTLVLPARPEVPDEVTAGTRTVAVRIPALALARRLCELAGPLISTSANAAGGKPPVTCDEAVEAVGHAVALALDGGPGRPEASTIVDVTAQTPRVLRAGAIPAADILALLQAR